MFHPSLLDEIQRHARSRYPEEACGVVTAAGYEALSNLHPEPTRAFRLPPETDERIAAGEILAVVHSHPLTAPEDPTWPSVADQQQQLAQAIPWGICVCHGPDLAEPPFFWGEGIPEVPLEPRDFRWGPAGTDGRGDCFALVRDWYRLERGLVIPDVPRAPDWLDTGPNLYLEGLARHGFQAITQEELRAGDALLCALQSGGRPNHAAIYLGAGYIFHHMQNRLSAREPYERLRRGAVMFLRPPAAL